MADKASIGIRQEQARNRLAAAAASVSEKLGVGVPVFPARSPYPELLMAMQMEAFANWAEMLDEQLAEAAVSDEADPVESEADPDEGVPNVYAGMSKAELVIAMHERGIDVDMVVGTGANGNVLKDDLITALEADDGEKGQVDG